MTAAYTAEITNDGHPYQGTRDPDNGFRVSQKIRPAA